MILSISSRLAALAAALFCSFPLAASDDRERDTPTGWAWYHGQTEAQVDALVASGLRIVDLDVESTAPYRFRVAMVRNSGDFAQTWWWRYGYTEAQVSTFLSTNTARMIDIEPVVVAGALRFAFVAVSNTGANAKDWWWYFAQTPANITNAVNAHNARLVDIERYTLDNTTWFATVMIRNTGADARGWWWYAGASQATLVSEASTKNARPYDLDRVSATTFDAILVKNDPAVVTAWYFNVSESTLNTYLLQYGMRPFDVEANGGNFDALMICAVTDLARSVNKQMRAVTDGTSGLYLREIGGSALAALHSGTQFEPASMLKTLHHVHAMRQVRLGNVTLGTKLAVTTGLPTDCPSTTATFQEDLESVLTAMMQNSDNRRTRAVTDYFGGFAVLNATAQALGMSETEVNHHIGCGTPANRLTLVDLHDLHAAVANGWLGSQREKFYELMLNSVTGFAGGRFNTMLTEEAGKVGLSASQFTAFKSRIMLAYKGGSYGVGGLAYRCEGGYVSAPFWQNHQIVPREYFVGAFVDGATVGANASDAKEIGNAELLRGVMHDAMLTWKSYVAGYFTSVGSGCSGSLGVPVHNASGVPELGETLAYTVSNVLPARPFSMLIGSSTTQWTSFGLPLNLDFLGAPGCYLRTNPAIAVNGATTLQGDAERMLAVPVNAALKGQKFHTQFLVMDPGANSLGLVATRALTTTLGGS